MQSLWRFLAYHNAVPVAFAILISGAGATFAATNPEVIYSSSQKVLSVDNTYIVGKDLTYYTPRIEIVSVTEDAENYYVAYRLSTIDVVDAVWQDTMRYQVLTVAKGVLGQYDDLGLYVTNQLKQLIDRQVSYLREVQEIEKKQPSLKTVATSYGGLVGKFLDDTTETLPGYIPVVTPPLPPSPGPQVASAASATPEPEPSLQPQPSSEGAGDTTRPVVQLLGDNPVQLTVGDMYTDLGVAVTDNAEHVLHKFLDGVEVNEIAIDTTSPKQFEIRYEATDTAGNTGIAERVVIVSAPPPLSEPEATTTPSQSASAPASDPASQPASDPASAPAPEPAPVPEPAANPSPEAGSTTAP